MIPATLAIALSAVILLTMLGLAAGNYATSIVYRLPRGLKIPNDPPYCDSCRHYLEPRDLFPFFSWVFNHGKCRFCGVKIPAMYAAVEWSSVMLFNGAFFRFGLGDAMILSIGLGMFLIILAAHYFENRRYYNEILIAVAACAALFRMYHDHATQGMVQGACIGLLMGLIGWGVARLRAGQKIPFPPPCLMPVLAGIALGSQQVLSFPLIALPIYAALKASGDRDSALSHAAGVIAGCTAIMIILLIPHIIL